MHGVVVEGAHAAQLGHTAGAVDGVDQVPGGQVEVHAAGHLSRRRAQHAGPHRAVAEGGQNGGQFDAPVKVGAGHVHAVVGQDVVLAFHAGGPFGAHTHNGKVGGAAADVGHQNKLLLIDAAFVVKRCRNGFVLELHLAEAHLGGGRQQSGLRLGVARGVVVHKKHRAAQHGAGDGRTRLGFGPCLQVLQVAGHDVQVFGAAAAAHVGGLVDQAAAQDAFHRAHQAAINTVHIGRHGRPAESARRAGILGAVDKIEHRRGHGGVSRLQLYQLHAGCTMRNGNCRIGSAEVDGAEHGRRWQGRRGAIVGWRPGGRAVVKFMRVKFRRVTNLPCRGPNELFSHQTASKHSLHSSVQSGHRFGCLLNQPFSRTAP